MQRQIILKKVKWKKESEQKAASVKVWTSKLPGLVEIMNARHESAALLHPEALSFPVDVAQP